MLSPQFLDHARNPRHVGLLAEATHAVRAIDNVCGDEFNLQLIVKDNVIVDAAYRVRGCSGAVALGSALCVALQQRATVACTREELEQAIAALIGDVPAAKKHALRLVTTSAVRCVASPL